MVATAQANAMKLEKLSKMTKTDNAADTDQAQTSSKMTKEEEEK